MSDQRFEAAKAAMQGMLSCHRTGDWLRDYAKDAVKLADDLLTELDKTATKPIEPDAKQIPSVCDEIASWPEWKRKAAAAAFCKPKPDAPKPDNTNTLLLSTLKDAESVLTEYLQSLQKAYTYATFSYGHKVLAQIRDVIAKAEQK